MSDKSIKELKSEARIKLRNSIAKARTAFDEVPASRGISMVLTKLDEAEMWADRI